MQKPVPVASLAQPRLKQNCNIWNGFRQGRSPAQPQRVSVQACGLRFLARVVRILMLMASTASENAMAK